MLQTFMLRRSFSAVTSVYANVAVGLPIDRNFSLFSFFLSLQSLEDTGGSVFVGLQKIKL